MNEIVLDTETTGLKSAEGDRIIEIGMVEINESGTTGRTFQRYLDPKRPMSKSAIEIHGITDEMLKNKPEFKDVADDFLEFIGDAKLVIHNAGFDMGFINKELAETGRDPIDQEERVVDTLTLAREELPNVTRFNLDALCQHFKIDRTHRTKHGALLDAELLAEVYFKLRGRNEGFLDMLDGGDAVKNGLADSSPHPVAPRSIPLMSKLTPEEIRAHEGFVESLGGNALWKRFGVGRGGNPTL